MLKAKRNDPCPCGSAKKYKACCMPRDLARERVKAVVGEDVFAAAEQQLNALMSEETVWEADVVPGPFPARNGEPPPSLALVTAAGFIVHTETVQHRLSTPEDRATAVAQAVSAAGRHLGRLPERLRVRDQDLAAALAPLLAARGVGVHAGATPQLDETLRELVSEADPGIVQRLTSPDSWRETGASREELDAFHRAAADFYRLEPWKKVEMHIPLALEMPGDARWAASVMGDAGVAFGLALYSAPEDLLHLMVTGDPFNGGEMMQGYALTVDFDHRGPLTSTMLREITAGGWPIAGPRAYPRLFGLNVEDNRITAEHVRHATLCLRAVGALARGADPEAETGVSIVPLFVGDEMPDDEDDWDGEDDRLHYFPFTETAGPMCAEGPGADPEGALRAWYDHPAMRAAEEERLARLQAWLREGPHAAAVTDADLENARAWSDYLVLVGVPAGAVTEYDLRLYLYDLYVRKTAPSDAAIERLGGSLPLIFGFLEQREGIRYPFAASVLAELADVARRGEADGRSLKGTLAALGYEVYDDLESRAMLHERMPIRGLVHWPDVMSGDVGLLDRELQRRWLLWYDEVVRSGITDVDEVGDVLLARQLAWENAPHPGFGGRTPGDVVRAYLASEQFLGAGAREMAG